MLPIIASIAGIANKILVRIVLVSVWHTWAVVAPRMILIDKCNFHISRPLLIADAISVYIRLIGIGHKDAVVTVIWNTVIVNIIVTCVAY